MKKIHLIWCLDSKNVNFSKNFARLVFLDPRPTDGPIKSPFSDCPSVCPSVSSGFFSGNAYLFFSDFVHDVDNWNI